jgi:hypothetical protein
MHAVKYICFPALGFSKRDNIKKVVKFSCIKKFAAFSASDVIRLSDKTRDVVI